MLRINTYHHRGCLKLYPSLSPFSLCTSIKGLSCRKWGKIPSAMEDTGNIRLCFLSRSGVVCIRIRKTQGCQRTSVGHASDGFKADVNFSIYICVLMRLASNCPYYQSLWKSKFGLCFRMGSNLLKSSRKVRLCFLSWNGFVLFIIKITQNVHEHPSAPTEASDGSRPSRNAVDGGNLRLPAAARRLWL